MPGSANAHVRRGVYGHTDICESIRARHVYNNLCLLAIDRPTKQAIAELFAKMIRAVLFDAFGTIVRPRSPIHVQYIAESYGILVKPDELKVALKRASKELAKEHPMYGKFSTPPLHYDDWWDLFIERTFQYADIADSDLQTTLPTLLPALKDRFSSDEGYVLHEDTLDCLKELQARNLKLGVISNSDPRIINVLESLKVVPQYIARNNITLSWEVGFSKGAPEIFKAASDNLGYSDSETLIVGDDLDEDYEAGRAAGLHSLLVNRDRHEADWVRREVVDGELKDVEWISNLRHVPEWVDKYNNI